MHRNDSEENCENSTIKIETVTHRGRENQPELPVDYPGSQYIAHNTPHPA